MKRLSSNPSVLQFGLSGGESFPSGMIFDRREHWRTEHADANVPGFPSCLTSGHQKLYVIIHKLTLACGNRCVWCALLPHALCTVLYIASCFMRRSIGSLTIWHSLRIPTCLNYAFSFSAQPSVNQRWICRIRQCMKEDFLASGNRSKGHMSKTALHSTYRWSAVQYWKHLSFFGLWSPASACCPTLPTAPFTTVILAATGGYWVALLSFLTSLLGWASWCGFCLAASAWQLIYIAIASALFRGSKITKFCGQPWFM